MSSELDYLLGERVRVHRNLHNGLFAISHGGRVAGYAAGVRLENVLPKVSAAGWKRCKDQQSRNVHAYLWGTLSGFVSRSPSGKGWSAISYRCKTEGPHFFFKRGKRPYHGSAEAVLTTYGKGKPPKVMVKGKAKAPNPSSDCGCACGPLCTCGRLQAWWAEGPPPCECENPMKNIRPCGSKPRDLGVYTTKHGAKLLLDLHNVRLYTKNIAKAKGFCPVIAGFLLGSVMIHRESVTPGHFRLADRGRKDVAKLAKRLGMKLHQLENELEIESVRWHDAVNLTLQNPAKKREWLPPEPGNVGQCDEVEKSLVSWGDIVTDGGDNSCLIETLAVVEKIGLGQKSDIYAEHSCARSSVDRSIKQALARSIPLVQKISTDKAKAHSRHLGLPYRPNRAFYELTETGLSYLCANLEGFHAGRAEQYAAGLTDADFESMERRAVEKDRQQAAYEAELIMEEQRRSAEQRRIRRAETGIPHSPAELEELIAAGLVVRTPAPVAAPAPSEERDWSREGLVPGTLMTPSEAVEAASLGFGPYSPPAPEPSPGPAPTISHALPPSSSSARRPIGPESWRIAPAVDYGTYVTINAEASNGEWAGRIRVLKGLGDDRVFTGLPSSASVMDFVVHPAFRASGLSRALFKAAADYAADRGMVLSSSVHRGMGQEKFWLKQLQGNIARRHDYRSGDHVAVRYALEGPVVPVLANPRRKKQSTVYVIRATCVIPGYANSNAVHYLSGFRDTEGTFSFSRYREKASRFRGLDLAELALHYAQKRIFDQTGQHYPLEIQPELGGHAMRPGCARPAGVR